MPDSKANVSGWVYPRAFTGSGNSSDVELRADPTTYALHVTEPPGDPLYVQGTSSNPVYAAGVSGSPVYVSTQETEKLWVKGTSSNPVYVIGTENDAVPNIPHDHHTVHEGKHYFIGDYEELGSAATTSWYVTTPNTTTWAHMTFDIEAQALVTMDVYEGGTYGGGGTQSNYLTPIQPQRSNRNSSNTTSLTIYKNGTASSLGSKIDGVKVGGATTPATRLPGNASREMELVLKQNTTYIWVITSGAASNTISYRADWYEEVMT